MQLHLRHFACQFCSYCYWQNKLAGYRIANRREHLIRVHILQYITVRTTCQTVDDIMIVKKCGQYQYMSVRIILLYPL
ncbi:hypothetical protein D3C71_2046880 [compost metagenome]